jgi:hypothetical protein
MRISDLPKRQEVVKFNAVGDSVAGEVLSAAFVDDKFNPGERVLMLELSTTQVVAAGFGANGRGIRFAWLTRSRCCRIVSRPVSRHRRRKKRSKKCPPLARSALLPVIAASPAAITCKEKS